jgi:Ferritin-like
VSAERPKPRPITTKPELIAALKEASEIEQQLMIQYLYAAFSLKKQPDDRCSAAQYESVRRWGSTILMVARSEMEHLALVNGLLTALGEPPWFSRENIPRQSPYLLSANMAPFKAPGGQVTPCDIPFVFERFNLDTIGRFVCAESPSYETLQQSGQPIPWWCFGTAERPCQSAAQRSGAPASGAGAAGAYPLSRSHLVQLLAARAGAASPAPQASAADSIAPGTIQELYDEIQAAIHRLPAAELFTGDPSQQVFVPIEYQINIFPITDVASADVALKLIVEEGEGIDAPPDYQSHFRRFSDVRAEMVALLADDPRFEASLPLPFNPRRDDITNPLARDLFDLFNYTYTTLVFLLTSLYRNFQPAASQTAYPYFSLALQEAAFGPMMTMLVRPLAEIMAYTRSGDGDATTGPDYHLSPSDQQLLEQQGDSLQDINFFLDRFGWIIAALERLDHTRAAGGFAAAVRGPGDLPLVDRQLRFVYESATAMRNNLRRIYQIGELPQFIVAPST